MTDDLVARLRRHAEGRIWSEDLYDEAADEIQGLREARDGFEVAAELWQKVPEGADAPPFSGSVVRDHTGRWHRALLVAHRERPGEWCWQPVPELRNGDS